MRKWLPDGAGGKEGDNSVVGDIDIDIDGGCDCCDGNIDVDGDGGNILEPDLDDVTLVFVRYILVQFFPSLLQTVTVVTVEVVLFVPFLLYAVPVNDRVTRLLLLHFFFPKDSPFITLSRISADAVVEPLFECFLHRVLELT